MSSERSLLPKYKVHVGRVFYLRKYAVIPCYDTAKAHWQQVQQLLDRASMLGDIVLVMDETNTRVCVTRTDGTTCWIQKYYLYKEIPNKTQTDIDQQVEAINSIMNIVKKQKENLLPLTPDEIKKLEEISTLWRRIMDNKS